MTTFAKGTRTVSHILRKRCSPSLGILHSADKRPFGTINVILRDDLPGKGYKGEEVSVRRGYMRNLLYPQKLAAYATPENRESYLSGDQTANREKIKALKSLVSMRRSLSRLPISFKRHEHQPGMPTRDVTAQNVSDYLMKKRQLDIPAESIDMPHGRPITSLGEHQIRIRVTFDPEMASKLEESLGRESFEQQSWVEATLTVVKR